jgi:hypothetical protein
MDDKQKSGLAEKLSKDKKFDSFYTQQNRLWFARAVVAAVAAVKQDSEVEAEATRIIAEANQRVAEDRDFVTGAPLDMEAGLELRDTARRVETIYGSIAYTLELADTSQNALRHFLCQRRYRGVVRMVYHVNPNSNGFFYYPQDCNQPPPPGHAVRAQPNVDTKDTFWEPVGRTLVPLRVKVPSGGKADPTNAAANLWIQHKEICDANLFDCAHTLCCVLMDTLFESAETSTDGTKMFNAVYGRGPEHLLIVNPTDRQEQQFIWDKQTEPKRLFSKEQVLPTDLQVGDHVYITNHGLYPVLLPLDSWNGEHALVTNCGTRSFSDGRGFLFSGHGIDNPQTVETTYANLLKTLQTALHRTYAIAKIFFAFRRSGDTSIPPAQVDKTDFQMTTEDGQTVDVAAYVIDVNFSYTYYGSAPGRESKLPALSEPGFIAFDIPALKRISIASRHVTTIDFQRELGMEYTTSLTRFADPSPGGNVYDRTLWEIPYIDTDTGTRMSFRLFDPSNGSLKQLERQKMPEFKFGRLNPTDTGASVTRPNSDPSPTYLSFLRSCGAVP